MIWLPVVRFGMVEATCACSSRMATTEDTARIGVDRVLAAGEGGNTLAWGEPAQRDPKRRADERAGGKATAP